MKFFFLPAIYTQPFPDGPYWRSAVRKARGSPLRHVRFGRDQSESTTRAYAGGIALFLRWCARTGRHWHEGVGQFGLFITWLRHAGPQVSGVEAAPGAEILMGPGHAPARSERRVNGVLTAVRGLVVHAVASGTAPAGLVPLLYEVADHRDLPEVARGEDGRMGWRLRARHRLRVFRAVLSECVEGGWRRPA